MAKLSSLQFIHNQRSRTPSVLRADLSGQTVVVTGANTGLGFEAAKHFARMNPGKLVIACRNKSKADVARAELVRDTGYTNCEIQLVDLSDFASVVRFANEFEANNSRLDILVCNAGIGAHKYEVSSSGYESIIQVNHLSTALVTVRFLPLMQKTAESFSTHPRAIIVTSDMHFWATIRQDAVNAPHILDKLSDPTYCTSSVMGERYPLSKLFNVLFTRGLSSRLPPTSPITVNAVNPGFCISNFRRDLPLAMRIMTTVMEWMLARTTEEGSRQLVWAALAGTTDGGNTDLRERARGAYVSNCSIAEASDYVFSAEGQTVERRLWKETLDILKNVDPKVQAIINDHLRTV